MKDSTTKYIAYDLRPSKQAERRILLDFLKCANEAKLTISDCRYVGMGGTTFYDFHLMHRFAGINRMISLERNPKTHPRCEFNCPYDFIKVKNMKSANFLATDADETKTIYWFDYDDGIGSEIIEDVASLGSRVKLGGFAFVTTCGEPPGSLLKFNAAQRLDQLNESIGQFAAGLSASDMENSKFPNTVNRILFAAFKNAFAARHDGAFHPVFQVRYNDSKEMVTVGGFFCAGADAAGVLDRIKTDLPFLLSKAPYRIQRLNLTERERVLFDMAVTKPDDQSEQAKTLFDMGFKKTEFQAYRELIRFWPRYHEAII